MDARWHNGSHRIVWLTVTHPKKSSRIQWESRELPSSPANQSAMYYTHKIHCIHRSKVNIWVHILVSFYFFFSFRCSFLISNFIDFSSATTIFVSKKVYCHRWWYFHIIFFFHFSLSFLFVFSALCGGGWFLFSPTNDFCYWTFSTVRRMQRVFCILSVYALRDWRKEIYTKMLLLLHEMFAVA